MPHFFTEKEKTLEHRVKQLESTVDFLSKRLKKLENNVKWGSYK